LHQCCCLSLLAGLSDVQGGGSPAYVSATNLGDQPHGSHHQWQQHIMCCSINPVLTSSLLFECHAAGVTDAQGATSSAYLSATNPALLLMHVIVLSLSVSACCHCLQVSVTPRVVAHLPTSAPPTFEPTSQQPPPLAAAYNVLLNSPCAHVTLAACCPAMTTCLQVSVKPRVVPHLPTSALPLAG
jgi:hypothetical protein